MKRGSHKIPHIKFIEALAVRKTEIMLAMLLTGEWFNRKDIFFSLKEESMVKCIT